MQWLKEHAFCSLQNAIIFILFCRYLKTPDRVIQIILILQEIIENFPSLAQEKFGVMLLKLVELHYHRSTLR